MRFSWPVAEIKITLPAWYVVMAKVIFSCCNNSGRLEEWLQVKGGNGFVDMATAVDKYYFEINIIMDLQFFSFQQ